MTAPWDHEWWRELNTLIFECKKCGQLKAKATPECPYGLSPRERADLTKRDDWRPE